MSETTAVAKRQHGTPTIKDLLEQAKPRFAAVLPRHLNADRLIRVTAACIARTPALQKCTPLSLLNCVMQAAQLGLEPTGVLGAAYLVPFGAECTLIIGYRGLIDLARRSGQIESIEAHIVHEKDFFICRYGLEPRLEHEPHWDGDPGPMRFVYSIAKLKDGGKQLEVMSRAQVDAIRARSKASGKGPWVTDYEEMARKTVVRRLAKYLPLSVEMMEALESERDLDRTDAGRDALTALTGGRSNVTPLPAVTAEEPPSGGGDDSEALATDDAKDEFRRLADVLKKANAQQMALLASVMGRPATFAGGAVSLEDVPQSALVEAIGRLAVEAQEMEDAGAGMEAQGE